MTCDKSAAQINVFTGGLKTKNGYHGGQAPKSGDSKITITGNEAFGGKVFLGSENVGFTNNVTAESNDLVTGKIKGVYGQGAESPNFNTGDWFSNLGNIPQPIPNDQYSLVGKAKVELKTVSSPNIDLSTVEGATTVIYDSTSNYFDTGVFKGVDNLSVLRGIIKVDELTYGNKGNLNLTVSEGAELNLSDENALVNKKLTVNNYIGGGTIVLPRDPNHFEITGTVDPSKKTILELDNSNQGFNTSNNMQYVRFANADSVAVDAFAFPTSYGERKLVKKQNGCYTNDVVNIFTM